MITQCINYSISVNLKCSRNGGGGGEYSIQYYVYIVNVINVVVVQSVKLGIFFF